MRALALGFLLLSLGCQSTARPWKVAPEKERQFGESRKACEMLTDDPEGFEKCMNRRGWRREYPGGF